MKNIIKEKIFMFYSIDKLYDKNQTFNIIHAKNYNILIKKKFCFYRDCYIKSYVNFYSKIKFIYAMDSVFVETTNTIDRYLAKSHRVFNKQSLYLEKTSFDKNGTNDTIYNLYT